MTTHTPKTNYLAYLPEKGYALMAVWGEAQGRQSSCSFHIVDQLDGYVLGRIPPMKQRDAEVIAPQLKKLIQSMNR